MKGAITSLVLAMFLMVATCKTLVQTQGNHLSEEQMDSLFKIFDRIESAINRNGTMAKDGFGNHLYIIKNLSLQVSFNFDSKLNSSEKEAEEKPADLTTNIVANISEILERITKLETSLQQNQKLIEEESIALTSNVPQQNQKLEEVEIGVSTTNVSELTNNTDTNKLPESIPETYELDPCKSATTPGLFKVQPLNRTVYCEMVTTFGDAGGWLVFQQRIIKEDDSHLDFNRGWAEYRAGFGTAGKDSEFWLGLEALHQITNSDQYELVVELKNVNEKYGFARYSQFQVAGEDDNYRLTVGGYSGTAGDALRAANNVLFSTYDNRHYNPTCGTNYWNGGWWYNTCDRRSAPNFRVGPYWHEITHSEHTANGIYSRMMIHRK